MNNEYSNECLPRILFSMIRTFVICLSLSLANACADSFSTGGCDFIFTNVSANCMTFSHVQCSWQECRLVIRGMCVLLVTVPTNNWGECMNRCCSFYSGPETYETLNNCKDSNTKVIIIVVLVIGGVAILVCSFFIAKFNSERIGACCQRLKNKFCCCFSAGKIITEKIVISWPDSFLNDS